MKAIDVDKIDWQDGCFFASSGEPIPIHHKIATIEMLRDWQPSCEDEIRADERTRMLAPYDVESVEELIQNVRAKAIEEFARRLNLKFVELPLDDLIVLDILKDINGVAGQMKGDKE